MVASVWGDGTPQEAYEIPPNAIISEQAADYLITEADAHKLIDYIGVGGHVITLPPSVDAGDGFVVWIRNSGAAAITIDPQGADTVYNGLASLSLGVNKSAQLLLKGSDFGVFASNGLQVVASSISVTPAGNIVATNVQAALQELDAEKGTLRGMDWHLTHDVDSDVNAITAISSSPLTAQAPIGSIWRIQAQGANIAGGVTLSIDGQVAQSILRIDATALQAGDIIGNNHRMLLMKGNTGYFLLNPANLLTANLNDIKSIMQAQTGVAYVTTGTADAFVLTPNPGLAAIAAYQQFFVRFHLAPNAASTIDISGLGARPLRYVNTAGVHIALAGGEIPAQHMSRVMNYSTYSLILDRPASGGALLAFTKITATNATWTPNVATQKIVVMCVGGGGVGGTGGAGIAATSGGEGGTGGANGKIYIATTTYVSGTYNAVVGGSATASSFTGTGIALTAAAGTAGTNGVNNLFGASIATAGKTACGPGGGAGGAINAVGTAGTANTGGGGGGGGGYASTGGGASGGAGGSGVIYVWEYA